MTNKISDIDLDGSKIMKVERDGPDLTITLNTPNDPEVTQIIFYAVTDERAEIFKEKGESFENTHFPPLDVIETFKEENGKYIFSGYLNNEPWSVWEFKASSYVIS